jgi:hypothetical protein
MKRDALERVLWTVVQAGLAVVSVEALGLDVYWTLIVAGALSAAKAAVAAKVNGSAALPAAPQ